MQLNARWLPFLAWPRVAPYIQNGILTGILLSLAAFLYRRMRPRIALVGLHGDGTLEDAALEAALFGSPVPINGRACEPSANAPAPSPGRR